MERGYYQNSRWRALQRSIPNAALGSITASALRDAHASGMSSIHLLTAVAPPRKLRRTKVSSDQATRRRLGWTRNLSLKLNKLGCRKPDQRDEEDQRHYVCAHSMLEIIGIVFL
jgi:hypothetical protein